MRSAVSRDSPLGFRLPARVELTFADGTYYVQRPSLILDSSNDTPACLSRGANVRSVRRLDAVLIPHFTMQPKPALVHTV